MKYFAQLRKLRAVTLAPFCFISGSIYADAY